MASTISDRNWQRSPLYRRFYEEDTQAIQNFLILALQKFGAAAGSHIVDLACGKGEVCRHLALSGFIVTGVDAVPENIEAALQNSNDRVEFYLHDIRLPFWGNFFNNAFLPPNGFGYYRTRREHDDAIRTAAASLKPGGLLMIVYPNVHYREDNPLPNESFKKDGVQYEIVYREDELNFYKDITIHDTTRTEAPTITEKLSKFSLGDFTDMLSYQGMQAEEVYGDLDFSPYDTRKTKLLIVIARKQVQSQK